MRVGSRGRLATAAVLVSSGAVALLAARPASPMTPPLAEGAEAPPILGAVSRWLGLDTLSPDVAALLGGVALAAAAAGFAWALVEAWRGRLPLRRVLAIGVLLHLLAVALPLLFSRDVYSYTIYGRMISEYGVNPYVSLPQEFPTDPVFPLVSRAWLDTPSFYGPAFNVISAGLTSVARSPAAAVFGYKLMAAAASIGTMLLAAAAAGRVRPERTAFAAMLIGWNPVLVFHTTGGGHNDALVGLAVAAAVLLLMRGRDLGATALLVLGTLVKVTAGLPLAMAIAVAVARRGAGQRLRTFGLHAGVAVTIAIPFVAPFMQTRDPTLGLLDLAQQEGWLAPSRLLRRTIERVADALGAPLAGDALSLLVRLVFPAVLVVVLMVVVRHLARAPERIGPALALGAIGWVTMVGLLSGPILLPWYMAWVLPLVFVLPRAPRIGAVALAVVLAATEIVAEPAATPQVWEAMVLGVHWVATPVALAMLVWLLADLRRRLRMAPAGDRAHPLLLEWPLSGEQVPDARQPAREEGSAGSGRQAGPVGGHRGEDRDRDPG